MAKRTVYHGTWSEDPPHYYGQPFHVGTEQAAHDRLFSDEGIPEGRGWERTIHAYEIDDSDVSPKMHSDPHYGDIYEQIWKSKAKPHTRHIPAQPTKIVKYLNDHEDRGSTSYVIPPNMIESGRVKHLGIQFHEIDFSDPRSRDEDDE